MKWENMYLVFEVEQGPKVVIETLNTSRKHTYID